MPVLTPRKLLELGHPKSPCLIGVTVHDVEEAKRAVLDDVDYVGIAAVWDTKTKDLARPAVGVRGVGDILDIVGDAGIPAVAIGGIKVHNALHTLHGPHHRNCLVRTRHPSGIRGRTRRIRPGQSVDQDHQLALQTSPLARALSRPKHLPPLVHQITNNVVIAQSAIALGARPIMVTAPEDMDDLGKAAGGLLVNFWTITNKAGMLVAGMCFVWIMPGTYLIWGSRMGKAANANKKPVVFDPVGVGATQFHRETANVSVIKGNAEVIGTLLGSSEATP
ncbi:unnamed protein product [Rhizoctonia solani]|uniref:hydroxyethylthiazole kinase n=1 Tax=Rhizoctonia solani TaxID=456999 RepID=A0A8H3DA35_9AGAM|nr:unnamed protein product [Rhizoctonia solani]